MGTPCSRSKVTFCCILFLWMECGLYNFMRLSGCLGSWLQPSGPPLPHTRSFAPEGRLFAVAGRLLSPAAAPGLSFCRGLALESTGSGAGALGLSCTWPCGVLVPRPGIELESPALQGGFLPTGPGEKPHLPLNS